VFVHVGVRLVKIHIWGPLPQKQKMSEFFKGIIWMNDGQKNYRIRPENVNEKIKDGLSLGFLKKNKGI
jgi:hypothetical protein